MRVIAATNRSLESEVRSGAFRADLFHRLAVVRVSIPPLRERREDIPMLVEAMLAEHEARPSRAALELLQEHDWPGNVRELRNVIQRALAFTARGAVLEPAALGLEAREPSGAAGSDEGGAYHAAKQRLIEAWERRYVDELLKSTPNGVTGAARRSGLGRSHLYRLINKYQLKV
jgi:DNA-binding NtrC family response regulator